jgi:alcohol dehydrogenase class IV
MHTAEADEVPIEVDECLQQTGQQMATRLDALRGLLEAGDVRRPMVVIDRVAVAAAGAGDALAAQLSGLRVTCFDAFTPNPRCEQAAEAARLAHRHGCDSVIGIGGGSCLDVAKVAALSARTIEHVEPLSRGQQAGLADPLPVIAIPTTSGTGSEATHFAAIYVQGRKVSVAHPRMRPRAGILDASLHLAMPATLAAVTGLDALAQAMESLWSVAGDDRSLAFARLAGPMLARSLADSVRSPTLETRRRVMLGAHLAGQAINRSKTTAAHAMSYAITQQFRLPHGLAVAMTLGHVAAWNARVDGTCCDDPRGPEQVRQHVAEAASWLDVAPAQMPAAVSALLRRLGLPGSMAEAGIDAAAVDRLADAADAVRLGNNPRRLDRASLRALLGDAAGSAASAGAD